MRKIYSVLLFAALCLCGTLHADQLSEGFEGDFAPEGWTNVHVSGSAVWSKYTGGSSKFIKSGSYSAKANNSQTGENYLITPKLAPQTDEKLTFFVKVNENANNASLNIKVSTTTADASAFATTLITYNTGSKKTNPLSTSWVEKTLDLSSYVGQEIYIAFHAIESSGYGASDFYLDDVAGVTIATEGGSSCAAVGKPELSEVTAHTAKLAWTAAEGVEDYQYVCVRKGEEVNWEGVAAQKVTSVTLDTLQTRTEYDFYVRSYCGAGEGEQGSAQKVTFQTDYSCFVPGTPEANEITSTEAKVAWEKSGHGETQWQYVVTEGNTADWSAATTVSDTVVTLTGLIPATNYTVFVRSFCGEGDYSGETSNVFRTECGTLTVDAEHDWVEDFESFDNKVEPLCWGVDKADASSYFKVTVNNSVGFSSLNSKALVIDNDNVNYGYVTFPEFSNALNTLQIAFSHTDESGSSSGTIDLGYIADGEYTLLKDYAPSTTTKTEDALSLASVPAGARLAFRYKSNSSWNYAVSIDDITLSLLPTCAAPTNLTVSEVTASSAVVTWTSEADAFVLQYKESVDDEWKDTANVTSPFILSDLAELTTYSVRVKAVCGESLESEWTTTAEFTTNCAVKAFPYENAFAETLALCWENTNTHGSNVWTPTQEGENYYLRYSSSDNGYNHATLATPVVALPAETEVAIMFKWMNTGVENVALQVSVDGGEPYALDTDLGNALAVAGNDWADMRLDISPLAGKTVQFFFTANGGNKGKFVCLDDFQVAEKPCLVPTGLQAVATVGGAELTWQSAWDESAWNLQYKAVAAEEWTAVNNLSENTYTLTGLAEDTEYEVQVQAVCSETKTSDWTESLTFTTLSTPSAIDDAAFQSPATKRVVNGQLLIERNGETFNAQGVSVK